MNDLTIVLIGTNNYSLSNIAVETSIENLDYKELIIFSDNKFSNIGSFYKINKINHIKEYSYFCLKCLLPFISTSHILIIQYDGFAVNKQYWDNEFLDYDYIGAPWIGSHWDRMSKNLCVGNGGFSLRSKKLLEALQDKFINLNEKISFGVNEDYLICLEYRKFLEDNYSIKFAPRNLAINFSNENGNQFDTFGFHGLWNIPNYLSEEKCMEIINFSLDSLYWDINSLNILLKYSHNRGYQNLISKIINKI